MWLKCAGSLCLVVFKTISVMGAAQGTWRNEDLIIGAACLQNNGINGKKSRQNVFTSVSKYDGGNLGLFLNAISWLAATVDMRDGLFEGLIVLSFKRGIWSLSMKLSDSRLDTNLCHLTFRPFQIMALLPIFVWIQMPQNNFT